MTVLNNKSEKNFPSPANVKQNCIKIKFMREYRGYCDIFVFLNVEYTSVIGASDIVGKLIRLKKNMEKLDLDKFIDFLIFSLCRYTV